MRFYTITLLSYTMLKKIATIIEIFKILKLF